MAILDKTIIIDAPVEKIFDFIIKPESWKEIYPKITNIEKVESLPTGGYRYHCKFDMFAGMKCEVDTENTEVVANQRLSYHNTCGLIGKKNIELDEDLRFYSEDGKTKITYHASNKVPVPIIHELIETLLMKMNERMVDKCLTNLKTKMET